LRGIEGDLRVAFEATGHYGTNLKLYLEREGYSFMECQPVLVAEYVKQHTLRKTKTDRKDAVYIAEFLYGLKPNEWHPVPQGFFHSDCLKRLTRFRSSLVHQRSETLVHITNVLDKTFPEFKPFFGGKFSVTALHILANYGSAEKVANMNSKSYDILRRKSHGRFTPSDFAELKHLARNTVGQSHEYLQLELDNLIDIFSQMDCRIDNLEVEIKEIVEQLNPPCYSIKGIGAVTAAVIIAEYGDFSRFETVDKALAFAGLEPQRHDSGQSHRDGRMHKHGSKYLREALMNAIMPMICHNPVFAEY
jgi:transposase